MNFMAKRVAKWFLGSVASVILVILGLVAWGLFVHGKLPSPPDVDKVAGAAEVRAAQRTAVRDVEAVYTTLEQTMGGRAAQRAEAVSDMCGVVFRDQGFFRRVGWSGVRCQREVMRAYVLDGPRAENATVVAVALEAGGWFRNGPGAVDPGTPQCPAPASSTVDATSTPLGDEPTCRIDAILPSRVSLCAEFWDVLGRSAYFPSRLRSTVVSSTTGTTTHIDAQAITNAPRPPGSSVVIVSVLAPYFTQQGHS
ncbi:hypothetical protein [Embleya scabrispora]|uniref:hypothetical protein n=1 Tax=Embleya scabrispora TaxID=159449 RepID=UPI000369C46A|nr:hypothetical protein [Embleya scabrispora]MYS86635.1 hypothetical protein [Streptomyces sp. SID5474]